MRFIHVYLVAYFGLVIGASLALWEAGVLTRVPGMWLLIAAIVVIGLGVVLAVTSIQPKRVSGE